MCDNNSSLCSVNGAQGRSAVELDNFAGWRWDEVTVAGVVFRLHERQRVESSSS